MQTVAVVFERPEQVDLRALALPEPGASDVVVGVEWTGVSTGTERLLWTGRMPPFPGLGYPLVPGYEAVGRITAAGAESGRSIGDRVFVPGAKCFGEIRGLFGGSASRLVVPGRRTVPLPDTVAETGVLIALAATAYHAGWGQPAFEPPDLIVGHGALGRLLARLVILGGGDPVVWETNPVRRFGNHGYRVVDPVDDPSARYRSIYDVSGDGSLVNRLIERLEPGGEVVLAGFYHEPIAIDFARAFLREPRIRIAAEFKPADLAAVVALAADRRLSLDDLITHRVPAERAPEAYPQAFGDPGCIKLVLDWRDAS